MDETGKGTSGPQAELSLGIDNTPALKSIEEVERGLQALGQSGAKDPKQLLKLNSELTKAKAAVGSLDAENKVLAASVKKTEDAYERAAKAAQKVDKTLRVLRYTNIEAGQALTQAPKTIVAQFEAISVAARASAKNVKNTLGRADIQPLASAGLKAYYQNLERADAAIRKVAETYPKLEARRAQVIAGLTAENKGIRDLANSYRKLEADEKAAAVQKADKSVRVLRFTNTEAAQLLTKSASSVVAQFEAISVAARGSAKSVKDTLGGMVVPPAANAGIRAHYQGLERMDEALRRVAATYPLMDARRSQVIAGLTAENREIRQLANAYRELEARATSQKAASVKAEFDRSSKANSAYAFRRQISSLTAENDGTKALREDYLRAGATLSTARTVVSPVTASATREVERLGRANKDAATHTHAFAEAQNVAHSAVRGVSGALGALWLSYAKYVPVMVAAAGATKAIKDSIVGGMGADFESQFVSVLQTGGEFDKDLKNYVRDEMIDIAKRSVFNVKEHAEALKVLSLAGIKAADALNLLETASQAAIFGQKDLKGATVDLIDTLNNFNLYSNDPVVLENNWKRVANVMVKASSEVNASMDDMAQSMRNMSGVAGSFDVKIEESAAILMSLAKAGIRGARGGTFARNFIDELLGKPNSLGAADILSEKLGMRRYNPDAYEEGDFGASKYIDELITKLRGLDNVTREDYIGRITNQRSRRALRQLVTEDLSLYERAITLGKESEGALAKMAEGLSDNAQMSFKMAQATYDAATNAAFAGKEDQFKAIGRSLDEIFKSKEFTSALDDMVGATAKLGEELVALAKTITENKETIKAIVEATLWTLGTAAVWKFGSALGNMAGNLAKGVLGMREYVAELRALKALGAFGAAGGVVGGVGAVAVAGAYVWNKAGYDIDEGKKEDPYAERARLLTLRNYYEAGVNGFDSLSGPKSEATLGNIDKALEVTQEKIRRVESAFTDLRESWADLDWDSGASAWGQAAEALGTAEDSAKRLQAQLAELSDSVTGGTGALEQSNEELRKQVEMLSLGEEGVWALKKAQDEANASWWEAVQVSTAMASIEAFNEGNFQLAEDLIKRAATIAESVAKVRERVALTDQKFKLEGAKKGAGRSGGGSEDGRIARNEISTAKRISSEELKQNEQSSRIVEKNLELLYSRRLISEVSYNEALYNLGEARAFQAAEATRKEVEAIQQAMKLPKLRESDRKALGNALDEAQERLKTEQGEARTQVDISRLDREIRQVEVINQHKDALSQLNEQQRINLATQAEEFNLTMEADPVRLAGRQAELQVATEYRDVIANIVRDLEAFAGDEDQSARLREQLDNTIKAMDEAQTRARSQAEAISKAQLEPMYGLRDALVQIKLEALDLASLFRDGVTGSVDIAAQSFVNFATTGKLSIRGMVADMLTHLSKLLAHKAFMMLANVAFDAFMGPFSSPSAGGQYSLAGGGGNLASMGGGTGLKFANGGAFSTAGIRAFAKGGAFGNGEVLTQPTFFRFASGGAFKAGVAGEAGPEAAMPLKRLPNGKLGVYAEGSGGRAVTIHQQFNVTVEGGGDEGAGQRQGEAITRQLRQDMRSAVLEVLVDQKRAGGILA